MTSTGIRSVSKLKKSLDTVFSQYIRLRDSVDGLATCITCGDTKPWKEMQNGHFIRRSVNHLRYDETNCNVQCYRCNVVNHGNLYIYGLKLDQKYGEGTAERLYTESQTFHRFTANELQSIIDTYKSKLGDLT